MFFLLLHAQLSLAGLCRKQKPFTCVVWNCFKAELLKTDAWEFRAWNLSGPAGWAASWRGSSAPCGTNHRNHKVALSLNLQKKKKNHFRVSMCDGTERKQLEAQICFFFNWLPISFTPISSSSMQRWGCWPEEERMSQREALDSCLHVLTSSLSRPLQPSKPGSCKKKRSKARSWNWNGGYCFTSAASVWQPRPILSTLRGLKLLLGPESRDLYKLPRCWAERKTELQNKKTNKRKLRVRPQQAVGSVVVVVVAVVPSWDFGFPNWSIFNSSHAPTNQVWMDAETFVFKPTVYGCVRL